MDFLFLAEGDVGPCFFVRLEADSLGFVARGILGDELQSLDKSMVTTGLVDVADFAAACLASLS